MKKTIAAIILAAACVAATAQPQRLSASLSGDYVLVNPQTNSVPWPPAPPADPDSTAKDIDKVMNDFGVPVSAQMLDGITTAVKAYGLLFLLARLLRKGVPDSMQANPLFQLLAHVGLEVNPQLTPPKVRPPTSPTSPPSALKI